MIRDHAPWWWGLVAFAAASAGTWALLALAAASATGQTPSEGIDPQLQLLVDALQQSRSEPTLSELGQALTQSPILAVILGLLGLRLQPQILGALGGTHDVGPALARIEAVLARHDERSRETRRETRRLRATTHWHAQILTSLAAAAHVELPPPPPPTDEHDDSDEERT